ncbi:uncharacterized protein [Prorops nasuta]|uniref:uncharacterized protein n=1 Tax=Prorops nasuta TaxID=863751 RepID=UPI0034CFCF7A
MNPVIECGRKDATNKLMNTRLENLKQLQNCYLDELHREKIKMAVEIRAQKYLLSLRESDYNRFLKEMQLTSIDMESVEMQILESHNLHRMLQRLNNFDLPRECPQEQKCSTHDTHNDVQKIEPSTFAPSMDFINQPQQYNANFFEMLLKK